MKKEEMRFSIRFNPADPRHRKAARMLNQVGRSKAVIVADALWEYDLRRGGEGGGLADAANEPGSQAGTIQRGHFEQTENGTAEESLHEAVLSGLSRFQTE